MLTALAVLAAPLVLLWPLSPPASPLPVPPQDAPLGMAGFAAQVKEALPTYDLIKNANAALLLEGDLEGATRKLLEAVPEDQRTAGQAFVLGNLLFAMDHEQSYRLHEEAYAKAPQVPPVLQEWALEQHRAGKHAEAEALYVELLALDPGPEGRSRFNALRADCLLHLDRPEEACAAWRAVDSSKFHTEIEESASWIYAPLSPEARRCALLQRARGTGGDGGGAGKPDPTAFDDLLLLDLHWDRDLWNVDVHTAYTAHDLGLAAAALGADSLHYRTLAFLARWKSPGRRFDFDDELPKLQPPADNSKAITADAQALKVIGNMTRPPENGKLASHVYQILVESEAVDAEDLVGWHEVELRRRAKSSQGDIEALRVLAALYEQTWNDELEELERMGWKRYGDVGCALGMLARQREELRSHDLVLVQALAANPGNVQLCRFAAQAAERDGELMVEPISRLIRAEFAQMEECQRVNALFRELGQALADRK